MCVTCVREGDIVCVLHVRGVIGWCVTCEWGDFVCYLRERGDYVCVVCESGVCVFYVCEREFHIV